MLPLFTDLKPQMTGKCSGSSVSVVSTLSMSKRSAVSPGHPYPPRPGPVSPHLFMISGDAPCLMALLLGLVISSASHHACRVYEIACERMSSRQRQALRLSSMWSCIQPSPFQGICGVPSPHHSGQCHFFWYMVYSPVRCSANGQKFAMRLSSVSALRMSLSDPSSEIRTSAGRSLQL